MPDQIPEEIKQERLDILMEFQQTISLQKNKALIGKRLDVLVESITEEGVCGRSYRDAPDIDGLVYIRGHKAEPGDFVNVKIKKADEYDLFA